MHVHILGTLNQRTGILMPKIYSAAEIEERKIAKKERARKRKEKLDKAYKLNEGTTKKETAAQIKAEAIRQAKKDVRKEKQKARLLATKEVTEKTILGVPDNKKIGKMGKLSLAALDRIAQLGFDPLEQSVNIARGTAFREDHPFLQRFEMALTDWCDTLGAFDELDLLEVERFKDAGIKALSNSFTPIDIRSKHTMELMTYLYPKRKSMEMSVETAAPVMTVTPLTEDEVDLVNEKIKERD